jgi:hypothetical protein
MLLEMATLRLFAYCVIVVLMLKHAQVNIIPDGGHYIWQPLMATFLS